MGESYYEVLGVPPDATRAQITAAYRERVLETHPDRNDDPNAAEQFRRVTAAEAVLADDVERARYDRLGHESYVQARSGGGAGFEAGSTTGSDRRTRGADAATTGAGRSRSSSADRSSGPSHHARHRRRRERATAEAATAGGWSFGHGRGVDADDAAGTDDPGGDAFSGYSVHEWDDEGVGLGEDRPPIDRTTWVIVGWFALLYPGLVYASVTPTLPLVVNATVAACAVLLVGYLLTIPRVAMGVFGTWSLLVPVALPAATGFDPFSPRWLFVVAAFWVPFGYAVAVWRVLRR